ncbi:hypothetical protein F4809DRAFT_306735 [Biscogniauxia mediterranea]|nr:hypothetical protein F4809DRAFT_306735 [Biscogniauxia mediterranea]
MWKSRSRYPFTSIQCRVRVRVHVLRLTSFLFFLPPLFFPLRALLYDGAAPPQISQVLVVARPTIMRPPFDCNINLIHTHDGGRLPRLLLLFFSRYCHDISQTICANRAPLGYSGSCRTCIPLPMFANCLKVAKIFGRNEQQGISMNVKHRSSMVALSCWAGQGILFKDRS